MNVNVVNACTDLSDAILTQEATEFLRRLHHAFEPRVRQLLAARVRTQETLDNGGSLDFVADAQSRRSGEWQVAPIPADLLDRRVEITGPVERKMMINALNSGSKAFMADLEDSHCPTWRATLAGQQNLQDAVRGTIAYTSPEGKQYQLGDNPAVLMVRPRGWHLLEDHFQVGGESIPASLFDFGLYFFHNVNALLKKGSGPYFYLPKMEHHLEARLWNDVFHFSQDYMKIPQGTIRATVLIETILAGFHMEEILYELKDHSVGLNCGRWDYIFSFIKKFRNRPEYIFPDRADITMSVPFMKAYCEQLIDICHRRGAHAMGGMAAQIPIKSDPEASRVAIEKVLADKEREVTMGHDGTWVAHPGLVSVALSVFDRHMKSPNQINVERPPAHVTAADLVALPQGRITEEGLRTNIRVGLQYLEAWLKGNGCVALYHQMEDAATAEICRTQIWHWINRAACLEEGQTITVALFRQMLQEEIDVLETDSSGQTHRSNRFDKSKKLFDQLITDGQFVEFLTLPAYDQLEE